MSLLALVLLRQQAIPKVDAEQDSGKEKVTEEDMSETEADVDEKKSV